MQGATLRACSNRSRTRAGTAKGRVRRIAIVAVARKLLIALWRLHGEPLDLVARQTNVSVAKLTDRSDLAE